MLSIEASTLSLVKLRSRRRHDADQAIEDDLQHRQPLERDEAGVDDPFDGLVVGGFLVDAEQAVDFSLFEDSVAAHWTSSSTSRTSTILAGAAAMLVLATSSSRRR